MYRNAFDPVAGYSGRDMLAMIACIRSHHLINL